MWYTPLPVSRFKYGTYGRAALTYGDYFKAATAFLSKNNFHRLISSVYQQSNWMLSPEKIENISIFLEKHGEYYHPSKIELTADKRRWNFVLNVATSEIGLNCAKNEFELLRKLKSKYAWDFIPAVYEYGDADTSNLKSDFRLFLGQWFDSFKEFHVHSVDQDGNCLIEIWDQKKGNCFISEKKAFEIYQQAAWILTCYHDMKTFEQIHPWHHAAGDFVVKTDNDTIEVKLVTARGYHPLVCNDENDIGSFLEAMLVFLMDLSIKNRIDRLKGVGDLVWNNDIYVMATINGFFKGFNQKSLLKKKSHKLMNDFGVYFKSFSLPAIEQLFDEILLAWPQQSPELDFVKPKIEFHAFLFETFMNRFLAKHLNV